MKFVVHDHYNNSRNPAAKFDCPPQAQNYSNALVEISDQGIAVFATQRHHGIEKRLAFLKAADALLKKEFGHGVCAVTSGDADCVVTHEVDLFFRAAKELGAKTIVHEYELISFIGKSDEAGKADFKLGRYYHPMEFVKAVGPTPEDAAKPQGGWKRYVNRLTGIYEKARAAAEATP